MRQETRMVQILTLPMGLNNGISGNTQTLADLFQIREKKLESRGRDPFQEVNTGLFLHSLLSGGKGAQKAFHRLTEVTHPFMARFVGKYFRSLEEAQEVVQE